MNRIILILIILTVFSLNSVAQLDSNYSKFLIYKSQAIDYYPVWGETDNDLFINLYSQEWRKYDLSKSIINEGTYLDHKLGINIMYNYSTVEDKSIIKSLEKDKSWKPRTISDKNGNEFSLEQESYNTALFIKPKKNDKKKIMNIQGNAHSLTISPTGKYLACLFEMTGLMVFDIDKELKNIEATEQLLNQMNNLQKAEYYLKNKEMDSFESSINNCSEKEKKDIQYNYYLGHILYLKCEQDSSLSESALQNLIKASEDSRYYDSNVMISSIYQDKNDWENSLKYAKQAIKLAPNHASGFTLIGDYYSHIENTEMACKYYKQAFEKGDQWIQLKLIKCK